MSTLNSKISSRTYVRYLGSAATALALLATSNSVMAQQDAATEELEEVVVTGSRIKRSGVNSPSPVTMIGAQDIAQSGKTNINDFLAEMPSLGSTYTMANAEANQVVGGSYIDLRRMGLERTLVLVDGRRHVAGNPGEASVDINTIPAALIERIDIVTGGASAVYGADAVTGVVNFILKDDFEGIQASAQYGHVGEGDHYNLSTSITAGGNFADDRGNAVLSVEYNKQNKFLRSERAYFRDYYTRVSNPANTGPEDGIPDRIYVKNAGNYIYSYGGVTQIGDTRYIFNDDGSFREQNLGTTYPGAACSDCDFWGYSDFDNMQPSFNKLAVTGKVRYELMDNLEFFMEGKFVNTKAEDTVVASFDWPNGSLNINRENPFVSDELGAVMDAAGADSFWLSRIHNDLGFRNSNVERNTYRVVAGFKGDINDSWSWEASYVYGRTHRSRTHYGNRVNDRFYAAVDAVTDPTTGETVCRSTITDETSPLYDAQYANNPLLDGCVPLNLLGDGAGSAEAYRYVTADTTNTAAIDQHVATAFVSGDLFDLPAGAVKFAGGVEYRREGSSTQPAELDAMGLTFLTTPVATNGNFNVKEIFGEVTVPVLVDAPFAQRLTVDAAIRYADYSTSGGNTSWKFGGEWQPIDDLRFRGTYGKAVRTPNISELFTPQFQTFFSSYDPCYDTEIASLSDEAAKSRRIANCAATGVPNADTREQIYTHSIEGLGGGNPDLEPEKSTSWTLGAVFTPAFLPDFSLTVDYWNISLTNAIDVITDKDIKDRCVDSESVNNIYCALTTRHGADLNYRYETLVQTNQNIAAKKASGIDFEANYAFNEIFSSDDRLDVRLTGTYLINLDDFPYQDDLTNKDEEAGELGDPKWLATLKTTYYTGDWTFSHTLRFIDTMYLRENAAKITAPEFQDPIYTGTKFYSALQVRYRIIEDTEAYVGVDNLFASNPNAHQTGTGADSGIYDTRGRFMYAGITTKF
ncbi:MAG: TonB-dependent receptor plug domain-containing protein [Kordiimonas sp.]